MNPEPTEIIIGDTTTWIRRKVQASYENDDGTIEYVDIKASEGWTLKFTAAGALGIFSLTASADTDNADDFKFTATAAISAAYVAGDYKWQLVATKTTIRYTIDMGTVTLLDNISVRAALYDNRSHAKKVLDAIEAVIENRATQDQMSYQIGGRQLSKTPISDLLRLLVFYKNEYGDELALENISKGRGTGRKILARFK